MSRGKKLEVQLFGGTIPFRYTPGATPMAGSMSRSLPLASGVSKENCFVSDFFYLSDLKFLST